MMGCKKCSGMFAAVLLVLGILFLLRDLNVWNFWNIQWWTAIFLLAGICGLCMKGCPDCQAMCQPKSDMKKK